MNEKPKKPREPMPASTVILVRGDGPAFQVYLLKRSGKAGFFPSTYVFPGGVVDREDRDVEFWKTRIDLNPEEFARRFGGGLEPEDALAYGVAAVRETFEEAGVFLADGPSSDPDELNRAGSLRQDDRLSQGWMRKWFQEESWTFSFSRLGRWSHWITPKLMKRHFNTRFFLALMPQGQACTPDQREVTEGIWISPAKALEANMAGTVPLSPPTIVTMHELSQFTEMEALEKEIETRPWGEERRPRLVPSGDFGIILQPWDPLCNSDAGIDTTGLEDLVLPPGEPFSRLWYHKGIWKPVRNPENE